MKNKNARKMLVDIKMKGRKLLWFGEESEIFAATSLEQLEYDYGLPDEDLTLAESGGVVCKPYKFLWTKAYDLEYETTEYIFKYVYGEAKDSSQILTTYG